jgi:hypothetical protein
MPQLLAISYFYVANMFHFQKKNKIIKLLKSQNAFQALWQYNKQISVQYGQLSHSWSIKRRKKAKSCCYNSWSQIKLTTDSTLIKMCYDLIVCHRRYLYALHNKHCEFYYTVFFSHKTIFHYHYSSIHC